MAVELVTGYAGQSHVGADEVRKMMRSLSGSGNYWCESAPTFSMTEGDHRRISAVPDVFMTLASWHASGIPAR